MGCHHLLTATFQGSRENGRRPHHQAGRHVSVSCMGYELYWLRVAWLNAPTPLKALKTQREAQDPWRRGMNLEMDKTGRSFKRKFNEMSREGSPRRQHLRPEEHRGSAQRRDVGQGFCILCVSEEQWSERGPKLQETQRQERRAIQETRVPPQRHSACAGAVGRCAQPGLPRKRHRAKQVAMQDVL